MQTISRTNGVVYRTKALNPDQAARFAKCLAANPHFTDVEIRTARNSPKRFVVYVPTSPERQAAMLAREADKRAEKAANEGQEYGFALDPDSPQPFAWCLNPKSGETYEVTLFDCTCPDFRYRCQGVGVRCKHMVSFAALVHVPGFETVGKSADTFDPENPFGPVVEMTAEEESDYRRWAASHDEPLDWEENW